MLDEALNEFHNRNGFFYVFVIFMAVVVESDKISIIFIDPWSGDYRTAKITADIFNDGFGVTFVGFGIDIETVFMFPVAESLALFERGADPDSKRGAEGVTKESIVEVADITPEAIVTVTTFRNEAMDVGVPF